MNSYSGQEAIATIVKHMEDNRSNLILIFAGYEKEMRMFIDSNSGLESRIKYWLHFGNYKSEELWQIFLLMAKQNGFSVDENVKNLFLQVMLSEIQKQNYGNARTVRNVLDKTIDQHAYNLIEGVIAQRNKNAIVPEDICLPVVIPNIPKVQTVSRYQ
jgi:stage V sporulation protein K